MQEEFKIIKGFEKFSISNLGNLRNLRYRYEHQLVNLSTDKYGYKNYMLDNDELTKKFRIHRLVAEAFIQNPDKKPCVDHINNNRSDNRVENFRI